MPALLQPRILVPACPGGHYITFLDSDDYYRQAGRRIHLHDCAIGGTFVIRREAFARLQGLRRMSLGADTDLLRRGAMGMRMRSSPCDSYVYDRREPDSTTHLTQGG